MAEVKKAGYFNIDSFKIMSYDGSKEVDIKMLIYAFNIYESMDRGSIRGTVELHETAGIIHDFPILGEEYLEITYTDFFDVQRTEMYFIYAITDVRPPAPSSQGMWNYKLHFTSVPKVFTEKYQLKRAFVDRLISDMANEVFDEFFIRNTGFDYIGNVPLKQIFVQPTESLQRLVIPNYTPEQTMHFFARKAWSGDTRASFSNTFSFFETRNQYYFCTNEWLRDFEQSYTPEYTHNFDFDNTPEGQIEAMSNIIKYEYQQPINSIESINKGGYFRKAVEIDMLHGTFDNTEYMFHTEFPNNNPGQNLRHSDTFINERLEREYEKWIMRDYTPEGAAGGYAVRPPTKYAFIYNTKHSHKFHTDQNRMSLTVYGSNEVFVGQKVKLEFVKRQGFSDADVDWRRDDERSGEYLIESINNVFIGDVYTQDMIVTKNGGLFEQFNEPRPLSRIGGIPTVQ